MRVSWQFLTLEHVLKEFNVVKCLEFFLFSVISFFRWNRQELEFQAFSKLFFFA